jgi:hypothetical protein
VHADCILAYLKKSKFVVSKIKEMDLIICVCLLVFPLAFFKERMAHQQVLKMTYVAFYSRYCFAVNSHTYTCA